MRLDQLPKIVRDRLNRLAADMPLEWRRVLRSEAKAMSSVVDDFVTAALRGSRKLMTRPDHCKQLEHFATRILAELPAKRDWLDPELERIGRDALKSAPQRPAGKTLIEVFANEDALAEITRLRELISNQPHHKGCHFVLGRGDRKCSCWKSEALPDDRATIR
jgi:hypothetical protein